MPKKYKCPHCPATFDSSDIAHLAVFTCGGCSKKVSIKKKAAPVSNDDSLDWLGDPPEPASTDSDPKPPPKSEAPEPSRTFKQQLDAAPVRHYSRPIRKQAGFLDIEFKTFTSVTVATILWMLAICAFVLGVGLTILGSAMSLLGYGPEDISTAQALYSPLFAALAGAIWLLLVRLGLELFVVIFRIYEELRAANEKR